jgi:hypothetical protein
MTGDNERQIRDRLGGALETITPATAPVGAVVRQGHRIRNRRRAGVAAGLAVLVGLGVALPSVLRQAHPHPQPAAPLHYQLTVNPPVKGARPGVIATGTANGKPWRVTLSGSGQNINAGGGGMSSMTIDLPDASPGEFDVSGVGQRNLVVGAIRHDVTDMLARLNNGTVLNLRPVTYRGAKWVGLVLPARASIVDFVAYSRHGELAHAVPYDESPNVWLKPGQRGQPRKTLLISSGTINGTRWFEKAYSGPWGDCFQDSTGSGTCLPGSPPAALKDKLVSVQSCSADAGPGDAGGFYFAQIAAAVRRLRLTLSDGSVVREAAVGVGPRRFAAIDLPKRVSMTRWAAYGASGRLLGSGRGWNC